MIKVADNVRISRSRLEIGDNQVFQCALIKGAEKSAVPAQNYQ